MERHVKIPISDIMDDLVQRVMNQYGVERSDVKCLTKIEYIIFEIPGLKDELCNEVLSAEIGENGEVIDWCGSSAGACICSLPKGHGNHHICEKCGEEWDTEGCQEGKCWQR